ncbi:hypothetical protein AB9P05_01720 [Roseivirga sp. BDSF3-8]|uniref:hypothetical protein n=1 Tax=Roseivirga sp. BDSF3-8 TaxID=3241598 RepID=UPI00353221B4
MQQIIEYNRGYSNPYTDAFQEALDNHELRFTSRNLQEFGFDTYGELSQAINRAMQVCALSGMPVDKHFRCVYLSDEVSKTVCQDWKLSKLAYTLVLLNGKPENPMTSRMQVELVRHYVA